MAFRLNRRVKSSINGRGGRRCDISSAPVAERGDRVIYATVSGDHDAVVASPRLAAHRIASSKVRVTLPRGRREPDSLIAMQNRLQEARLDTVLMSCLALPDYDLGDSQVVSIPRNRIIDAARYGEMVSTVKGRLRGVQGTVRRLSDGLATWVPRIRGAVRTTAAAPTPLGSSSNRCSHGDRTRSCWRRTTAGPESALNRPGFELPPRSWTNPGGFMRTFDVKFKRKVVRANLSGKGGYKILARRKPRR
jgi:hypothetical protein